MKGKKKKHKKIPKGLADTLQSGVNKDLQRVITKTLPFLCSMSSGREKYAAKIRDKTPNNSSRAMGSPGGCTVLHAEGSPASARSRCWKAWHTESVWYKWHNGYIDKQTAADIFLPNKEGQPSLQPRDLSASLISLFLGELLNKASLSSWA